MPVSDKVRGFMEQGGWIRRMFEAGINLKAQHGEENVFDLSLGNPVVEPPEQFRQELRRLAENPVKGMHRYMPNNGYPETRQAVADGLKAETGIPFSAGDIVGEMALVTREPRSADIVAESPVCALALPAEDFHRIVVESAEQLHHIENEVGLGVHAADRPCAVAVAA